MGSYLFFIMIKIMIFNIIVSIQYTAQIDLQLYLHLYSTMGEYKLCIVYFNCPHCYSTSSSEDEGSDASETLCSFRRCPHCFCTGSEGMSTDEEEGGEEEEEEMCFCTGNEGWYCTPQSGAVCRGKEDQDQISCNNEHHC